MPKITNPGNHRLRNLSELHGKTDYYGAPKSGSLLKFLNSKGVSITDNELTKIYWSEKEICACLAQEIEQAFELPIDWLSQDHEFIFKLSPEELSAHRALTNLPLEIRTQLYSLVITLAPGHHEF